MVAWSRETTTQFAYEPLGSSFAAAIIVCILFFGCLCMACYSLWKTRFPYYDVVIVSAGLRVVAYALRAAYLTHYRPALQGAFVAIVNSAFGANTAVHSIAVIQWLSVHGLTYFNVEERYVLKWISLLLCVAVLILGWGTGITGSAMEYGAYTRYVVTYGQRLRMAASYGLAAVCFVGILVTIRICWAVYFTQSHKSGKSGQAPGKPEHRPRLIFILLVSYTLLSIRAATGCVALYAQQQKYAKWWSDDRFFYPFNTLPELVVMIIDVWPTLYARMCQRYPPGLPASDSFKHKQNQTVDPEQGLRKLSKAGHHQPPHHQKAGPKPEIPAWADTRSFLGPKALANGHDESAPDDSARQGWKARPPLAKDMDGVGSILSSGGREDQDLLSSQNILLSGAEHSDSRR